MKQPKKPKNQQSIEAQLAEDQSTSITASFVQDIIYHQLPIFEEEIFVANCGLCGSEIWIYNFSEDTTYLCAGCANKLPR